VALAIEMTFLGLVFSAALSHLPVPQRVVLCVLAPSIILVGGAVGASAASLLLHNHVLRVLLISFGGEWGGLVSLSKWCLEAAFTHS
jgi:hypothetical protein